MAYEVRKDKESLTAELVNGGKSPESVRLRYTSPKGDSQVDVFRDGDRITQKATLVGGYVPGENGNSRLPGLSDDYGGLGPELRAQLPSEMTDVLGDWFRQD